MKRSIYVVSFTAGMLGSNSTHAEIDTKLTIGLNSAYVWRAVNYSERNQTDSIMYHGGLNFSGPLTSQTNWKAAFWGGNFGNDNLGEELERGKIQAGLSQKFGSLSLEAGLISYYGFSSEFFVDVSTNYAGLDFKSILYYDIEHEKGRVFTTFAVSKGFEIAEGTRFTIEANCNGYVTGNIDKYFSYGLVASVQKKLSESLSARVYFTGEKTENHAWDGDDFYGGISLTYSF